MNRPEEITPEQAERLVALLGMMGDLDRDGLAFLVGHMASKNIDLAIEAFGALMATQLPVEDQLVRLPWAALRLVSAPLEVPGCFKGVFDGSGVAVGEVGDNHHVLGEPGRHAERLGELSQDRVAIVEIGPDHQVAIVELTGNEPAVVAPLR
jgi:hypothetical protein